MSLPVTTVTMSYEALHSLHTRHPVAVSDVSRDQVRVQLATVPSLAQMAAIVARYKDAASPQHSAELNSAVGALYAALEVACAVLELPSKTGL